MRITHPGHVSLVDPGAHPLVFTGQGGERFQISVLEDDLIRVQHLPDGQPRLDRTWMVVGTNGDVPREGLCRDDLSPFSLPGFYLDAGKTVAHLRTRQLHLEIALGDFRLRWADATGRWFAAGRQMGDRIPRLRWSKRPPRWACPYCFTPFSAKVGLI